MITRPNSPRLFVFPGLALTIAAAMLVWVYTAHAQASYTVLHSFSGPPDDGADPEEAGLIQGPDGTLYGTTYFGGSSNFGTIFQMAPDGSSFTLLHSFNRGAADGAYPGAGLIQGPDGTLYGTTYGGGSSNAGTIFQMAPDGSGFTLLHSFNYGPADAYGPAGLIQGPDGTLYGIGSGGSGDCGFAGPCGTIFQMAPDGSGFTLLHSFNGGAADGAFPAGLIQGPDGTLYGTTRNGGSNNVGTIFRVAPDGSGFTLLHSFQAYDVTDGALPYAGLIQGPDGTLYGTTYSGGSCSGDAFGCGTIYRVAPDGSGFTLLHSFNYGPADGAFPYAGLIQGPDGTLYGTTLDGGSGSCAGSLNGCGTIFRVASDGSGFTLLHSFSGPPDDGARPHAGLIQGPDGTLYGTTSFSTGSGDVVFKVTF